MRRLRRSTADDTGSASLEFVTAGVLMLVPLVYLVFTLSVIQSGAFAVEGAARAGARVFVQAATQHDGVEGATDAVDFALDDYGFAAGAASISITCLPDPANCLTRHGRVMVTVRSTVPLPLVPPFPGLKVPAGIPMVAASTEEVSRFAETR
ncbi:MAG: hypothetical protein V4479_12715 [Actinomycetota bacterium]